MEAHGAPPGVAHSEPLSPGRQRTLSCDIFWNLMDRWKVPTDRALTLIGHDTRQLMALRGEISRCQMNRPGLSRACWKST